MARIAGVNIPNHQHADVALTAIYGIGRARARAICVAAGVDGMKKVKDLSFTFFMPSTHKWTSCASWSAATRSRATCAAK
jgi:hypothetical protein